MKTVGASPCTLVMLTALTVLLIASGASSAPAPHPHKSQCEAVITNSVSPDFDWTSSGLVLAQCLRVSLQSLPEPCVFYTRGHKKEAVNFAIAHDGRTVYDMYKPAFFDTSRFPAMEWERNQQLHDLFRITSKAYAMTCSGNATLVLADDQEPCPNSIWLTDELNAIKSSLTGITAVHRASWDNLRGKWTSILISLVDSLVKKLPSVMKRKLAQMPMVYQKVAVADKFDAISDDFWAVADKTFSSCER